MITYLTDDNFFHLLNVNSTSDAPLMDRRSNKTLETPMTTTQRRRRREKENVCSRLPRIDEVHVRNGIVDIHPHGTDGPATGL